MHGFQDKVLGTGSYFGGRINRPGGFLGILDALNQPINLGRLGDRLAGFQVRVSSVLGLLLPAWIWEDQVDVQIRLSMSADEIRSANVQVCVNGVSKPALVTTPEQLNEICQGLLAKHAVRRGAEKRLTLILPADFCLHRSPRFPLSTRRSLREAGELQVEVETPFLLRDVYVSTQLQNDKLSSEEIVADLTVAPRRKVDALIQGLRALGVEVTTVAAQGAAGTSRWHHFDAIETAPTSVRPKAFTATFFVFAFALLTAVIYLPLAMHAATAEREEAKAAKIVAEAGAITAAIDKTTSTSASLLTALNEKQKYKDLLPLLETLSKTIPADSYIERLSYRNDQLQISGFTPSTSTLIDLLIKTSQLASPTYLTPVNRQNGRREHFDLSFHLADIPSQ